MGNIREDGITVFSREIDGYCMRITKNNNNKYSYQLAKDNSNIVILSHEFYDDMHAAEWAAILHADSMQKNNDKNDKNDKKGEKNEGLH